MLKSRESLLAIGVRQKVIFILLTVLLTALSLSAWLTLDEQETELLQQVQQRGTDISRFAAKSLAFSVVGYDYHGIQLIIEEITQSEDVGFAQVLSSRGNVMAVAGERGDGTNGLVMFEQDIELENENLGKLVLGLSTRKTVEYLEQQKNNQLIREAMIILLIAIGEFLALSYIIIRPVCSMTSTMQDGIDEQGQIVKKLPIFSRDEFGRMAGVFNNLSDKLNHANNLLRTRIKSADEELIKTNNRLVAQSKELEKINAEFKKLSITDELTGIYNRRHFEELMKSHVEVTKRYGDPISLLLIDIDHFKKINDSYGHPCGDQVLVEISEILKADLRKSDTLCRIGGEEFAVLCQHADTVAALDTAEKLRVAVESKQIDCDGTIVQCTISVGISSMQEKDTEYDQYEMYRQSDIAVYYAKRTGRNRVIHYDHMEPEQRVFQA